MHENQLSKFQQQKKSVKKWFWSTKNWVLLNHNYKNVIFSSNPKLDPDPRTGIVDPDPDPEMHQNEADSKRWLVPYIILHSGVIYIFSSEIYEYRES